jgi:lipid II:glycine glycyltransferase (peptidoglycan interpeptide bridge formation enzyme)
MLVTPKEFNETATHPLQTWEWGEFRKKTGNIVYRTNSYQLTIHPLPVFKNFKIGALIKGPKPTKEMIEELKEIAQRENLIFIKLEPNVTKNGNSIKILKQAGAVPGKTLFTPTTFWIDLAKSEEELLKSFHPKTRYNIKVAQKHEVEVREDNSDKAFKKYLQLTRETSHRQGFYAHSERYHKLMWQTLHTDMVARREQPIARILTAIYKNEIITTWILFVWKDFLYYPYGASTDRHKHTMANNLMMWEAIKLGKKLKLKVFDLWGREEGKGFTKFKEGFGPKVIEFLGTWDLPTSSLYTPYTYAEKLRWFILRTKNKITPPNF